MRRLLPLPLAACVVSALLPLAPVGAAPPAVVAGATADCSAETACTVTWTKPGAATVTRGLDPDRVVASPEGAPIAGTGSATFTDLDPTVRSYFEIVPKGAKRGTVVADRSLHLTSAPNARDLGGYETTSGQHVRWGEVFRSDAISEVDDQDLATLTGLGIKIVCDFRGPSEVEADGPDVLPPGAELVSVPIFDAKNDLNAKIRSAITSADTQAQEALLGGGRGAKILADAARFFVDDRGAAKQFSAVLDRLADPASLPALTHCTAGKDRTGWSSAVLLTALGVPSATVFADYLLTNDYTKEKNASTIASVASLMADPTLLLPVLEVRREYLQASFDAVKKRYGSFTKYLRKGLGVTPSELTRLRKNLLTD